MPRKPRLSVPGAVTHVMARCLPRLHLYEDDQDRRVFLQLLERYLSETRCDCYAWALMPTHYHLVLRVGELELWRTMKPLNMRYAQYHGKKHGRRGPLLSGRYKSIVTQDQNCVQELVRYVHLNPLRAGICRSMRSLDCYPWTGHSVLMGRKDNRFQNTKAVLARFGKDRSRARQAYREFLAAGIGNPDPADVELHVRSSNRGEERGRGAHRWVIGDPEFVKDALARAEAQRLRTNRLEREGKDMAWLAAKVCADNGVPPDLLSVRHRGGPVSAARREFCYIATREYGVRAVDVAAFLGISPGAVSNLVRKSITLRNLSI